MKNKNYKLGFTLLELLIVILIIGILAGIALPQYKRAVTKSKYSTLKNITNSLYQAQQVYYMTNDTYADRFNELDVTVKYSYGDGGKVVYFDGGRGRCVMEENYLYCIKDAIKLGYIMRFSGQIYCVPYDDYAKTICASETGSEPLAYSNWYPY